MISLIPGEGTEEGNIGVEHFIHTYGIILSDNSIFANLLYGTGELENKNRHFNIIVKNCPEDQDFKDMIVNSPAILYSILHSQDLPGFIKSVPFISINGNNIEINSDIFSFIGKCITGGLDSFWRTTARSEREKLGKVPFIDVYEKMLFLVLLYVFEKLNTPFVCKSFWHGERFAVCLTHDVDEVKKTYQWVTRPLINLKNSQVHLIKGQLYSLWDRLHGKEPYWTFDEIMKLEDELNVKSSFYFLNERSRARIFSPGTWKLLGRRYDINDPGVRQMMRRLHAGGWDIGLHGSYESYNDVEMLEKEKKQLEFSLGNRITGTRQHHLNIDIPGTWECHEKIGLDYDTTLGFKDQMGFRGGTCLPFHPYSGQKRVNLVEIPLAIMDTPLFKHKNEILESNFKEMINIASEFNGVLTLLWHHAVFNKHEYPGWSDAYEKIIQLCRKKNAWITSAKEIAEWWNWREKAGFELNCEGNSLRITPHQEECCHFLKVYPSKNMKIKKIINANIIENDSNSFIIRTNSLKNDECIEIEFLELKHGS